MPRKKTGADRLRSNISDPFAMNLFGDGVDRFIPVSFCGGLVLVEANARDGRSSNPAKQGSTILFAIIIYHEKVGDIDVFDLGFNSKVI